MKKVKWRSQKRGVVLMIMVFGIVLVALTSVSFAAPAPEQALTRPSIRQATVFDPFAGKTITPASTAVGVQPVSPPGVDSFNARRAIRVPVRLAVRSFCRPGLP